MLSKRNLKKNLYMINGKYNEKGYDWWWHSFTAISEKTGEERPFFIEYFIINPLLSPEKYVLGQNNQGRPSYLMVKCGSWGKNKKQLHRFYNYNDVTINKKVLDIKGEDFSLSEERITGKVERNEVTEADMCDVGSMSWDIKLDKRITYDVGYGTSPLFIKMKAFDMYWHAQGIKTLMTGEVTYEGEKYVVKPESCYGYSDKNWGKDFTSPWVWLSSWDLVSELTSKRLENSAFEIGGGRPRVFGITLNRKLLIDMVYEGKKYEFNFSKFWTFTHTVFDCYETDDKVIWNVKTKSFRKRLVVKIECDKKDMLFINYEAPDGEKKFHRLFNGGNGQGTVELYKGKKLIDRMKTSHVGCEYGIYQKEGDNYYKK